MVFFVDASFFEPVHLVPFSLMVRGEGGGGRRKVEEVLESGGFSEEARARKQRDAAGRAGKRGGRKCPGGGRVHSANHNNDIIITIIL